MTIINKFVFVGFISVFMSTTAIADKGSPNPTDKWAWLAGTTWINPSSTILAYSLSGGQPPATPPNLIEAYDQTIYTIEGYKNGYFWGTLVTALQPVSGGDITYSCNSMLGPITPQGDFLIGATAADGTQNMVVGKMVKVKGKWSMENTKVGSYTHWGDMVQSKPGDASYLDLPFVHISVPTMLGKCPNYTPIGPQ